MNAVRPGGKPREGFLKHEATEDKSSVAAEVGDKPTLEAIYAQCARFVWLTLQRLGVRKADLDDVSQEVFIVLQRKLPEFQPGAKLQPWVFAICVRTASNYRRLARVRLEVSGGGMSADDDLNPAAPVARRPDHEAANRERLSRAEVVLAKMSPLRRSVFVMFELEGMSCQEIAAELGLPIGTVYSRLHSARASFAAFAAREAKR